MPPGPFSFSCGHAGLGHSPSSPLPQPQIQLFSTQKTQPGRAESRGRKGTDILRDSSSCKSPEKNGSSGIFPLCSTYWKVLSSVLDFTKAQSFPINLENILYGLTAARGSFRWEMRIDEHQKLSLIHGSSRSVAEVVNQSRFLFFSKDFEKSCWTHKPSREPMVICQSRG